MSGKPNKLQQLRVEFLKNRKSLGLISNDTPLPTIKKTKVSNKRKGEENGEKKEENKRAKTQNPEDIEKKKKLKEKKVKNLEIIVQEVKNAISEAEKRIGKPIESKKGDIYYRWSSLGIAAYIKPEWQFLSNMSPFPVLIDDILFPTLEHYFQAMKWCKDPFI